METVHVTSNDIEFLEYFITDFILKVPNRNVDFIHINTSCFSSIDHTENVVKTTLVFKLTTNEDPDFLIELTSNIVSRATKNLIDKVTEDPEMNIENMFESIKHINYRAIIPYARTYITNATLGALKKPIVLDFLELKNQ